MKAGHGNSYHVGKGTWEAWSNRNLIAQFPIWSRREAPRAADAHRRHAPPRHAVDGGAATAVGVICREPLGLPPRSAWPPFAAPIRRHAAAGRSREAVGGGGSAAPSSDQSRRGRPVGAAPPGARAGIDRVPAARHAAVAHRHSRLAAATSGAPPTVGGDGPAFPPLVRSARSVSRRNARRSAAAQPRGVATSPPPPPLSPLPQDCVHCSVTVSPLPSLPQCHCRKPVFPCNDLSRTSQVAP